MFRNNLKALSLLAFMLANVAMINPAKANLSLLTTERYFDENTRVLYLEVYNTSNERALYEVDTVSMIHNNDGSLEEVGSEKDGNPLPAPEWSLAEKLRIMPAKFIIGAKEIQKLKLILPEGGKLDKDKDFWVHVSVGQKMLHQNPNTITALPVFRYPFFWRHSQALPEIKLSEVSYSKDNQALSFVVNNDNSLSLRGELTITEVASNKELKKQPIVIYRSAMPDFNFTTKDIALEGEIGQREIRVQIKDVINKDKPVIYDQVFSI